MSADWGGQSAECCQTPVGVPKPKNLNPWGEAPEVGRAVTCIPKSSQARLAPIHFQLVVRLVFGLKRCNFGLRDRELALDVAILCSGGAVDGHPRRLL